TADPVHGSNKNRIQHISSTGSEDGGKASFHCGVQDKPPQDDRDTSLSTDNSWS
ncbi:hypothetical protein Dimus_007683, partial [Dionaea muscipula]